MTPRVREMLSWYQGDSPGTLKKISEVLNHGPFKGTGKLFTMTVDSGIENGPAEAFAYNPDSFDPHYYFQTASRAGLNALIAPQGVLEVGVRDFIGDVPLILKMDHLLTLSNFHSAIKTSKVETALELGCVGVALTLPIGMENFDLFLQKMSCEIAKAKKHQLLVHISVVRAGQDSDEVKKEPLPLNQAAYGVHLACQMGGHIIQVASVDKPVSELRELYDRGRILFEKETQRQNHVIKSAFAGQRVVLGSFRHESSGRDRAEELSEWIAAGASGMDLGDNSFVHPQSQTVEEIDRYLEIIKG